MSGSKGLAHRVVALAGNIAAFVFLPGLALTSIFDIATRRFLQLGSTPLQELTWHFFFACVMFGIGFTYLIDKHVRVDVIRQRLTPIWRERTERTLLIVLLIPLALTILWFGSRMAWISFVQDEGSRAALGLSSRWIIKAALPAGALFLLLAACVRLAGTDRRDGGDPG
ncbi:TRAP transporter small permease subunit [Hyphomonas sp.]|jgi:TRAP-type mannitol/chloroaromatic compound transport system permease small subunit|uniref:TRAP transporter small permease subunit n=1 Tax=Hyphomonas sp. TaxID=87 RepID=UPI00262233EA|nr:TRAP transporter small permease subunit [Hyphomonas sp.]MDF1806782.1 TRAP transporter small permease subunit [Hyphomonas sp.]